MSEVMQNVAPVFIVSSERSGSNLLRRRISETQKFYYGPPPIHLLKHFFFRQALYMPLQNDDNFISLVTDCLGLCYNHFSPWDQEIKVDEVIEFIDRNFLKEQRNAVTIMHAIYTCYVNKKDYESYICKDNNLFEYVPHIKSFLPQAKFILLVRDPRDFILSQLKRKNQVRNIRYLSQLWVEQQKKLFHYWKVEGSESHYFINYEDFITYENEKLAEIMNFLKVDRTKVNAKLFSGEKTTIHEWKNLNQETLHSNKEKFRFELSSRAVFKIEAICGVYMKLFGYLNTSDGSYRLKDTLLSKFSVSCSKLILMTKIKFKLVNEVEGYSQMRKYINNLPR